MVLSCSNCGTRISVSLVPGGNPAVALEPDQWARSWQACPSCHDVRCEACLRRGGRLFRSARCDCGEPYTAEARDYWYARQGRSSGTDPESAIFLGRLSAVSRPEAARRLRRAGYGIDTLRRYGLE